MYNFDGRYSIQDAPAHLVNLAIFGREGQPVDRLLVPDAGKLTFRVVSTVYLPNPVIKGDAIYLDLYPVGNHQLVYLGQQRVDLVPGQAVVELEFSVTVPVELLKGASGINLQLTLTRGQTGQDKQGINPRGRFVNTVLPLGVK